MSTTTAPKKTRTFKKLRPKDNITNGTELQLLTIEVGIPVPSRGSHDPVYNAKIHEVLKTIKPTQSFVIEAKKLHNVQSIAKKEYPEYQMRASTILPDKKFARIWRLK